MLNLNEKYFTISEPCGRNHQNKFCLRPLKRRFSPWELNYTEHVESKIIIMESYDENGENVIVFGAIKLNFS